MKQAKLLDRTFQHANTDTVKENESFTKELNEVKPITKSWFNSSDRVSQCISEQIPNQKLKILGEDQLTEGSSSDARIAASQKVLLLKES